MCVCSIMQGVHPVMVLPCTAMLNEGRLRYSRVLRRIAAKSASVFRSQLPFAPHLRATKLSARTAQHPGELTQEFARERTQESVRIAPVTALAAE